MDRADSVFEVRVACSPAAGLAEEVGVAVPAGATLLDALRASGFLERHPLIDLERQAVGVWGRVQPLDAPLAPGDRVEIYRPLQIDPKDSRRRRQRQQRDATCSPQR